LNSKVFEWEFKTLGIDLGKSFEWKKQYVERCHVSFDNDKCLSFKINNLVEEIIKSYKNNDKMKIDKLEKEINVEVYKLYDLNEQEIKIIESN